MVNANERKPMISNTGSSLHFKAQDFLQTAVSFSFPLLRSERRKINHRPLVRVEIINLSTNERNQQIQSSIQFKFTIQLKMSIIFILNRTMNEEIDFQDHYVG